MTGPARFRFLNRENEVGQAQDWNDASHPRLWLYNLHYFGDLCARDAELRAEWHRDLIERWIIENPPGHGAGWEPYPTSLRIVNWIKWALAGHALSAVARHSLAVQTRYLAQRLEHHLLGNHLLANVKALAFAGLWFDGEEADRWFDTAHLMLARELPEQILADGGHFERSPMYHAIVLADVLDLHNIFTTFGRPFPQAWSDKAVRMCRWLATMCHPDGEIALFNDAAFAIAPTPEALLAYAGRLGVQLPSPPSDDCAVHLADSGYVRLCRAGAVALLDVGPLGPDYLPAHGHADTLSFELSLHAQRVIVDAGCSRYEAGAVRDRERGTRAHNTLVLDGLNSSDVWGTFRVGRRARVQDVRVTVGDDVLGVCASHDGYRRFPAGGVLHQRCWSMAGGKMEVVDSVLGVGRHRVEIAFHLHPQVVAQRLSEHRSQLIHHTEGRLGDIELDPALRVATSPSHYNPQFGLSISNLCLVGNWEGPLPVHFTCTIEWDVAVGAA